MSEVKKKVGRKPAERKDARFPQLRKAYAAFVKALAKKAGVSTKAVDKAIQEYGLEAAKKAAEAVASRPNSSDRIKAKLKPWAKQ
jgi:hypothetical protein